MDEFILEHQRTYNCNKLKEITLPVVALAFKLLDVSQIPHRDYQFFVHFFKPSFKVQL